MTVCRILQVCLAPDVWIRGKSNTSCQSHPDTVKLHSGHVQDGGIVFALAGWETSARKPHLPQCAVISAPRVCMSSGPSTSRSGLNTAECSSRLNDKGMLQRAALIYKLPLCSVLILVILTSKVISIKRGSTSVRPSTPRCFCQLYWHIFTSESPAARVA